MKSKPFALLALLLAAPWSGYAAEQLIPAGSLIQCILSEPKLNSKTAALGDPVLCQLSHAERYGRSVIPYNSYLVGRFEDYKDPGHLVGKGWLELRFDRMVIEPDTIVPVDARVVDVPGYNVDRYGRILGRGHAVRDTVTWMIPLLWPMDLMELPRRGPRPTLKGETRLTLKVMDDLGIPMMDQPPPPPQEPPGLVRRAPSSDTEAPPAPALAPVASYGPVYMPPPMYIAPPPVYLLPGPRPLLYAWGPRPVMVYRNGLAYRVVVP